MDNNTPLSKLRLLGSKYKIPPYPKPPYSDDHPALKKREKMISKFEQTISELAQDFIVQMQESDDGIKQKYLDFSPKSLSFIDTNLFKIDYPNHFDKDYLKQFFIPTLSAYLIETCMKNIDKKLIKWKFAASYKNHALQPAMGGRLFYPFHLAEDAVFSGYRLVDFYEVVASFGNWSSIMDRHGSEDNINFSPP